MTRMNFIFFSFLIIFGINSKVFCEPDAGPEPSPVADAGRNRNAVAPVITRNPIDQIVRRNTMTRMECSAEGYPSPQISWIKDGAPFKEGGDRFVMPTGEIMIYRVGRMDEGVYQCVAKNSAGVARSPNATLQISYIKEEFQTMPQDTVAAVGETAELQCEGPRGIPQPTIRWKKDGRRLPASSRIRIERGKLVISGASKSDSGQYQCVASNDAGTRTSMSVLLSVHEPPVFTATPQDKTVVAGENFDLVCQAKGDPKPRIRWTRPSSVPNSRISSLSNGNLRITNVQPGDAGRYECSAENIVSEIKASAVVTVNRKPHFTSLPSDTTARVGEKVTIHCWAEGKPVPTILWRIGSGENMFPGNSYKSGHIVIKENGDLTIYNVKFSDQGQYTCEAYNSNGPINAKAQLSVKSRRSNVNPPIINQGPSNMTLAQGSEVEFKCSSSAVPVPVMKWTKDGSEDIKTGNRFTVTMSGSLKITNIQNSDAGKYTCTATNDYGWSGWDAWVKVAAKGVSVQPPNDDVTNLPSAPGAPVLVNSTSSSIRVRWTPGSNRGTSPITGYILEYYCFDSDASTWNRVGGRITSTSYTVQSLKPSSRCVFLVRAQNEHGTSDPSEVSTTYETLGQVTSGSGDDIRRKISQISVKITSAKPLVPSGAGIRLDWDSSAYCNVIDGFRISVQAVSIPNEKLQVRTTDCYASNIDLKNLRSRVTYEIRIQAYKGDVTGRSSPIILASTESEGFPPKIPTLKVDTKVHEDEGFASATFSWSAPGGILPEYISGYSLRCYDTSGDSYDVTKHFNSNVTSLTMNDLPRGGDFATYITYDTTLGEGQHSETAEFSMAASASDDGLSGLLKNPGVLAGIAACVVLVIAIIVGVILYIRHKKNKKSRGLHGRAGIPMDPFSGTQYSKGFTMSLANPGGNNNYSDGTASSSGNPNGNIFLGGMTAPTSMGRNTTVSLNNSNGNVGTSLSPDMRPTARHASSFSYVTDQLTSMANIPPQFSSPNLERTPTQAISAADLQLQLQQQQQYQRQISENPTILAGELTPRGNLIDMNTPPNDDDLPPPPPSPPMSQKTSLSDRTNRSRGSSRNSAERGSSHSKGRRSRERNRNFQPMDRVLTDTDTGIDSPQQTPSPPRPQDLRAEHPSGVASQSRGQSGYPFGSKQLNSRRRNNGIAVEYARSGDQAGYLGEGEFDTESELDARHGRSSYIRPHPEDVRNSVTVSSVSMMNRYDSESACSERSHSPASSIDSLNMESASQVGVNAPRVVAPSAFVPIQHAQRGVYVKPPKVPRKHTEHINGHYVDPQSRNPNLAAPEQFLNRVNSASSSASSSYHQNTADSGMSAGVGSYGHNSLNSSSSTESAGPKGQMSRSRTTGSLSADNQPHNENAPAHFASVDRRHTPNSELPSEYQQPRTRLPAPQPRRGSKMSNGAKTPPRKNSQDSNFSLPPRDDGAYIGYDITQPMLPEDGFRMNESEVGGAEESSTPFLAAKSVFASGVAPKQVRGLHPNLSDVPEVSTSDFCEDYSDRSQ